MKPYSLLRAAPGYSAAAVGVRSDWCPETNPEGMESPTPPSFQLKVTDMMSIIQMEEISKDCKDSLLNVWNTLWRPDWAKLGPDL